MIVLSTLQERHLQTAENCSVVKKIPKKKKNIQ
jgi:hypothetical protein